MSVKDFVSSIQNALSIRFGKNISIDGGLDGLAESASLTNRKAHRQYQERDIDPEL